MMPVGNDNAELRSPDRATNHAASGPEYPIGIVAGDCEHSENVR